MSEITTGRAKHYNLVIKTIKETFSELLSKKNNSGLNKKIISINFIYKRLESSIPARVEKMEKSKRL